MIETLRHIDYQFFQFINTACANPVADVVCPILRNKATWIPLYLLLAFYIYKHFSTKLLWFILFGALTVLLSDQTASHIVKPLVHRLRPCNNPDFQNQVRLLVEHCGNGFSFVSAHAANHFALSTFFVLTFPKNKWNNLFYLWAAIISLSQVYVGVHFPADVAGGALLGIAIGALTGNWCKLALQNNRFHPFSKNQNPYT